MNLKTFTSNVRFFLLATVFVFTGLQSQAEAALTVFIDKATFFAETGATNVTGPLPLLGNVSSAKLGSITISNTSGSSDPSVALALLVSRTQQISGHRYFSE